MEFFPISRSNGGPEIAHTSILACLVPFGEERLDKFKVLATKISFSPWLMFLWIVRLARHTFGVLWWEGIDATFLVTKKDERNKVTKEETPGLVWRMEARHPSLTYLLYCTVYNNITTQNKKNMPYSSARTTVQTALWKSSSKARLCLFFMGNLKTDTSGPNGTSSISGM